MRIYPIDKTQGGMPVSGTVSSRIGFTTNLTHLKIGGLHGEWREETVPNAPPNPFIGLTSFVEDNGKK